MTIMSIQPQSGTKFHNLESQSHRTAVWMEGYIEVPQHLREKAQTHFDSCDLLVDEGVLVDILPVEAPETEDSPAE